MVDPLSSFFRGCVVYLYASHLTTSLLAINLVLATKVVSPDALRWAVAHDAVHSSHDSHSKLMGSRGCQNVIRLEHLGALNSKDASRFLQ